MAVGARQRRCVDHATAVMRTGSIHRWKCGYWFAWRKRVKTKE
jgi:hypothetical protein